MKQLTENEKHLINQTIKKCDSLLLEIWLKDSKRWRKNWNKKAEL